MTTIISAFSGFTLHSVTVDLHESYAGYDEMALTAEQVDEMTDVVSYPIIGWRIDVAGDRAPEPITPAFADSLEGCREDYGEDSVFGRTFTMAFIELPDGRLTIHNEPGEFYSDITAARKLVVSLGRWNWRRRCGTG
jgi:hypothetical protein